MRALLLFYTLLIFSVSTSAQQQAVDPVTWQAIYKPLTEQEGELLITATIEKGWHTYSQRPTDAGPISTIITFKPSPKFELSGTAVEYNLLEEYDKAFEARLFMFSEKAEFRQKVKLKSKPGFSIGFSVEYVACSDMMCLPPKSIDLIVKTQ